MISPRLLRLVLPLALAASTPSAALAQTKPAPSAAPTTSSSPSAAPPDAALAEARKRFNEGIDLADAGDHDAARTKFSQAWVLLKSPAVLYNLARAEQLSGHPVEAIEHFRAFVRMSDPAISSTQRQRAAENIAELTKRLGQIDIEAPTGARLSVDGRAVESATPGEPLPVAPGKHVVEAVVDGKVHRIEVEAKAGTIAKAKIDDAGSVAAKPPEHAAGAEPSGRAAEGAGSSSKLLVAGGLAALALVGGGVGLAFLVDSNAKAGDATDFNRSVPGGACARRELPTCTDYTARLD